ALGQRALTGPHRLGVVVGLVPGVLDVLPHRPARVEVGQLEVRELRSELVADVIAGGVGELPDLTDQAPRLAGELGEPVGTEDDDGDHDDDQQLRQPDPEHCYNLPAGLSPSCIPASPRPRPDSVVATRVSAWAAGVSGCESTIGVPVSPPSRSVRSSGISPSTGTS